MSTTPSFSPVTQVSDPGSAPTPPEDKVTEDQFNTLHASSVTYRDLLIFEERLKHNMIRLRKRQQKYEAFLGSLIVVIVYCAFATFYHPSQTYYIHVLHKFFLLLSATTLFLFFATGMYSEKLSYSSKFVPQCNRVLRVFNMHFNRDNRPELSFFRKVPRRFQEEFSAFKVNYFRRKSERRAARAAGSNAGGVSMLRTGSGQNRVLLTTSRGRRVAGGGGGGSASGSDSGARSTIGMSSLTRGDSGGRSRRPLLRQNSVVTSGSNSTST